MTRLPTVLAKSARAASGHQEGKAPKAFSILQRFASGRFPGNEAPEATARKGNRDEEIKEVYVLLAFMPEYDGHSRGNDSPTGRATAKHGSHDGNPSYYIA